MLFKHASFFLLNRLMQFAIICTGAALLASCAATVYKLYEVADLPPDKIAVLVDEQGWGGTGISVEAVDSITPFDARRNKTNYGNNWDGSFRIELLPGKHTVSVKFGNWYSSHSVQNLEITFYAEAGKVYTVKYSVNSTEKTWDAWVEEIDDKLK